MRYCHLVSAFLLFAILTSCISDSPVRPKTKEETSIASGTSISPKMDNEERIPPHIQAHIPRHATITWHTVSYGAGRDHWAILYSVPVLGGDDSLKYLVFFTMMDEGSVIVKDRIYFGGRGRYVIGNVSHKDGQITVHAREHQSNDSIANPTRQVNIIIEYGSNALNVSEQYPTKSSEKTEE